MESLVVPAISVTMVRSSPIKALTREDFPAFGRPTTDIRGKFSNSSDLSLSGLKWLNKRSKKSPVPEPFAADRTIGSPKPRE